MPGKVLDYYWFTFDEFHGWKHPIPAMTVIGSALAYLFLIFVFCPLTAPTNPKILSLLKKIWFSHNIVLFIYSAICTGGVAYYLTINNEWTDFQAMACNEISRQHWLWYLQIVFVYSKIYEWLDTMFMVWTKPTGKKLFLHVYHHSTTFWLMVHVTCFPGTIKMGLLLNGGVHTMMYHHYAWPWPKALVPVITAAQIGQLGYLTYVWHVTPTTCPQHAGFQEKYPVDFAMPYAMVPVYLMFFLKFFVQRFILGQDVRKKKQQ